MDAENISKKRGLFSIGLYLPGNVWILSITSALWSIGLSLATPFQSVFFEGLGASPFYIGILSAISSAVTLLAYFLGGYFADAYGRKKLIIVFSFISAASAFLYFFINTWTYLLIPIVIGAFSGIYTPAFNAMLNDSMDPEFRAIGFASYTIITTLPSIFSPYIGGLIIENFGVVPSMKFAFVASGIIGLIAIYWRMLKLKETCYNDASGALSSIKHRNLFKSILRDYLFALRNSTSQAKKLLLYSITSSFASGLSTVFVSVYLINKLSMKPTQYGFLVGISAVATIVFLIPSIHIIRKYNLKKIAVLSALSAPASMLIFVSANGMNDLMAWSATGGVSGSLLSSVVQGLQGNATTQRIRGRFMALFSMFSLLAMIPGQVISGFVYASISPLSTFVLAIPFYIISVLILLAL
ncbi:MAG: MFS transporter [Candidatus Micrarchaeia archaeon]